MSGRDPIVEGVRAWRENPALFVWNNFAVEPDAWQLKALRALASNDHIAARIAMQACAGPGKTAVLAWVGWWFLSCFAGNGEHPKGAAVSVTADNLRDNLWSEFSKWQQRSEFLKHCFEWTAERIYSKQHPETWFIAARAYAQKADAEAQGRTLSGLHAKYILYLIDESGDIPPAVLRSAEQGLSNCEWGKIVTAGNPTSHDGVLYHAVNAQSHLWTVVRITGDPDDRERSKRISLDWAKEQIAQYGRDNPWVMAYILGLFPPTALNALLGPDQVRAAIDRKLEDHQFQWAAKVIGCDVARFGDDRTVLFPRQGLQAFEPSVMRHARTHEISGRVVALKREGNASMIFVDHTGGWGAGLVDALYLGKHPVTPVEFAGKATDPKYFNKRSEMYWEAADWVKRGGALPNVPELIREATAARYWFDKGKLRVEEKDQIKARLGNSPDLWDAFVTTFAAPVAPDSEQEGYAYGAQAPVVPAEEY
jgi:hypothetical protein